MWCKIAATALFAALMSGFAGCGGSLVENGTLPPLVSPEQLTGLANVLIVDVRPADDFLERRIPQAVSLESGLLSQTRGGVPFMLREPRELAALLSERSIGRERAIVVYGAGDDARAVGAATRVVWALRYMRYPRVSLLDGGLARWIAEDRPTVAGVSADARAEAIAQQGSPSVTAAPADSMEAAEVAVIALESRLVATVAEISTALASGGHVIIDGRRREQYSGSMPARGVARSGRIPGAVNIHYADLLQEPQMTFKPVSELEQLLYPQGITRDSKIIVYCNAGNTSTVIWLAYLLLGHEEVANYDGSMLEWAADEVLPLVKDEP